MIDKELLLSSALLNIFRSTDTEMLLKNLYDCLQEYMPLDMMYFSYYLEDSNSVINLCTIEKGKLQKDNYIKLDDTTTPQTIKRGYPYDDVYLLSEGIDFFGEDYRCYDSEGVSTIILQFRYEKNVIGYLTLKAYRENAYTFEHKNILKKFMTLYSMMLFTALINRKLFPYDMAKAIDCGALHKIHTEGSYKGEIIGEHGGLKSVVKQAKSVAEFLSAVLITGETGVGKEVFANFIHRNSPRRNEAFVKVNCGAMPETLIDNELFGHEKGAFTGADSISKGRFELADKGTIFLDEIGELPLNSQTRLLRVLQFGAIERLGSGKSVNVDVRIISATNRDLLKMVEEGSFREDLYWRLNVFPLNIPPVRERKEDIPQLIRYIVEKVCRRLRIKNIPSISSGILETLVNYDWPGNVREMENVIEREIILNRKTELKFENITFTCKKELKDREFKEAEEKVLLDDVMKNHILKTLTMTNWRISGKYGAAYILGIHPNTLRHRMKKLGIF